MSDPQDVRMRGFARRGTVAEVLAWLDEQAIVLPEQCVTIDQAADRVLARAIESRVDVPGFRRAMMDGFALRADDTLGADPYNAMPLLVVGESLPGRPHEGTLGTSQAVRIMTGAPMPTDADAVLPVEQTEPGSSPEQVSAIGRVSPGKHVGHVGEDVAMGTQVLPAGRRLRPQDVGLLASIGQGEVPVVRKPRVRIVVTGDELLPAGDVPRGCRIVDSNGPMLAALVRRDGGIADHPGIVPDRPASILEALEAPDADVVLVSGGSSVGQEDHAPNLLRKHGRLVFHGLAMRPSSPAGMGLLADRLVFLLPGNPVSCLCAHDFFAGRAIRILGGRPADWPHATVILPTGRKIASVVGRLDYVRVRIVDGHVEPIAVGGASVLTSTTRADGFVLVGPDSEGCPANTPVTVHKYDFLG